MNKIVIKKICLFSLLLPWIAYAEVQEVNIGRAVEMALTHSAEIKASRADYKAQGNKYISSLLDMGPRISANYNEVHFDKKQVANFGGGPDVLVRDKVSRTGSLVLTQPLTGLFALLQKAKLEGIQKNLKSVSQNLSKMTVAFKTAETYLRAQESEEKWKISQSSIKASEAQRKDGISLVHAGRIHKSELLKLELAVSQSMLSASKAQASKDISKYTLMEMIGVLEGEQIILSPFSKEEEILNNKVPTLDEGLKTALLNRLEIKQTTLGQDVAHFTRLATYSKFFPSINFFAELDYNFGNVGLQGEKDSKKIGINLNWEIWNTGAHLFQIKETNEQVARSWYQSEAIKQQIRIDIVQVSTNIKAAYETLSLSKKAAELADEAYRIEKLKFSLGQSSATDLILSETAKTVALGNIISAITELKIQELKLQQALGKQRPEF